MFVCLPGHGDKMSNNELDWRCAKQINLHRKTRNGLKMEASSLAIDLAIVRVYSLAAIIKSGNGQPCVRSLR